MHRATSNPGSLSILPFGEDGEIIVNSPGMMKGYLNLTEETEKALRQVDGATYMFTGDVGNMDSEGYITIGDRAKDMLIVGGCCCFCKRSDGLS